MPTLKVEPALSKCALCCRIGPYAFGCVCVCTGVESGWLAAASRISIVCKPEECMQKLLLGLSHPDSKEPKIGLPEAAGSEIIMSCQLFLGAAPQA